MEDRKLQTATSSPPTVPSQSPSQLTSTPSPTQSASTPSPTSSTTATTPAPTQSQAAPTDAPSSGATSAPSAPPTSSIAPTAPIPQEELINWEYENVVALRWNIQNPPQVTYNGLTFDLIFTVSDYVEPDDHVRYELYEGPTCGDETKLMADDGHIETEVAGDNTPVGGGIMTREVTVSSTLNPQTISKSGAYQEESASDASITFCVQFSLWSGPTSDTEATMVNSVDATVALSVDLTDDFSISGQQLEAREQDVKTSDDKFFVEAFLCDGNGDSLQDILPFVQGQALRICVKPTQQAYDVGFRMKRVDKFRFEQGYTTQEAIINEDVAANGLTQLYCYPGADQCMFETLLFAYFFQSATSIVQGNGIATLQWGTGQSQEPSHRRLRTARSSSKQIAIPDVGIQRADSFLVQRPNSSAGFQRFFMSGLVTAVVISSFFGF